MFDHKNCIGQKIYSQPLILKKREIQCDQSNIIECGEGDVERAKMGGYQITMSFHPMVLFPCGFGWIHWNRL